MNTQEALTFGAAAPFILLVMTLLTNAIPIVIPSKWNTLISLVLTTSWGLVLVFSNLWDGSVAVFIVTDLTVTYAVIGLRTQAADAKIPISRLSGQVPPEAR